MRAPARVAITCAVLFFAGAARADVERFAVVIGNNDGDAADTPLRYAESDATRIYEVLRDLGDFRPANMVLLKGEDARTVVDTVVAVNERVRMALAQPGSQAMLFVYYSGHADAGAFHLGRSRLSARLLWQLIHGSAATFRLMVLDSCRSGVLTRSKGGSIVAGAPVLIDDTLPGSGLAVLAASAADEDAQESEEIRGSFFTHAFVSGLLGAADQDGDGAISLAEAYQYAYGATLRATSRTLGGLQHPTFRYDFSGQGTLVLTRPESFASSRSTLQFPTDIGFIVLRESADGAVVGEVGPRDRRRALSVRPGRYFVRGRSSDALFEADYELERGASMRIDTSTMKRIEYARLVRKGGATPRLSPVLEVGAWLRSPLSNADTVCSGAFVGFGAELEQFGLLGRAGMCTSGFSNARVDGVTNEYDLEARLARTWDLAFMSFDVGLGGGAALFTQRFDTRGSAAPRDALSPYVLIAAGASRELGVGYGIALEVAGETHFLRFETADHATRAPVEFAVRVGTALSKAF